jgi:putative phosphoribosyl transferase
MLMSFLFQDRNHAGKELAYSLKDYLQKEQAEAWENRSGAIIVLAIPRGGVIIGDIISTILRCRLDTIVSKKIGAQYNKELAIGAVMPDGSYFVNEDIVNMLRITKQYIESEAERQKKEIGRRLEEFRGHANYENELKDKVVILVDDGIATGSTVIAASKWIKGRNLCKKLVVAVPVAPAKDETIYKLNKIADKVMILHSLENFYAVGQFYKNFEQVNDDEVKTIMKKHLGK